MKRAIGIIRVSRLGDEAASPDIQAERIEAACEREGLRLLTTYRELDISGGKPLAARPGLRVAVEAVERGEADVIVVAYFDRLVRSLKVQQEVVDRVEAAGGEVLTLDVGKLTNGTAAQRLTGNFLGAVAQFVREQSGEKSAAAQERAVAAGRFPGPTPLGYRREGGRLVPDDRAPLVRELFERRAAGASANELRGFLAEHGIERTMGGVRKMLASRLYIGEIHYRNWHNPSAHKAIVPWELFERVQRMRVPAGRKAKSPRLLARQGILHCGTCGARMVLGGYSTRALFYRCGADQCPQRVTVGADLVEREVLGALSDRLAGERAVASLVDAVEAADNDLAEAQTALDAAITGFAASGVSTEPTAIERLGELRTRRDAAQAARDALGSEPVARIYGGREIVERGTVDERRELLRALGCRVTILPGRRPDRIAIEFI